MKTEKFALGQVVENPDLVEWEFADENLPIDVVCGYIFARALGASLGPGGEPLEYPMLRHLSENVSSWDEHWRNLAAVVVIANPVTREVYAIVRHGPTFRLVRLREQARP